MTPDKKSCSVSLEEMKNKPELQKKFPYVRIYSDERSSYWWLPDAKGYTLNGLYAGIYTVEDALKAASNCDTSKQIRFVAVYDQEMEIELHQQRIMDRVQLVSNLTNEIESLKTEIKNTMWFFEEGSKFNSEKAEDTAGLLRSLQKEINRLRQTVVNAEDAIDNTIDKLTLI